MGADCLSELSLLALWDLADIIYRLTPFWDGNTPFATKLFLSFGPLLNVFGVLCFSLVCYCCREPGNICGICCAELGSWIILFVVRDWLNGCRMLVPSSWVALSIECSVKFLALPSLSLMSICLWLWSSLNATVFKFPPSWWMFLAPRWLPLPLLVLGLPFGTLRRLPFGYCIVIPLLFFCFWLSPKLIKRSLLISIVPPFCLLLLLRSLCSIVPLLFFLDPNPDFGCLLTGLLAAPAPPTAPPVTRLLTSLLLLCMPCRTAYCAPLLTVCRSPFILYAAY